VDAKVWNNYWGQHRDTRWELNRPQATILERIGFKGKSVLEVGVGSGTTSRYLAARGAATVGIDISPSAIQLIKRESSVIDLVCADARALPFSDCSFDVVFHQGVLEHFKEPFPLLLEQRRVLKEGGALLVDVPQRYQLYTLMKRKRMRDGTWPFGWETEYSYLELKRLLEDLGFGIRGHYANYPEWFRLARMAHTIGRRRFGRPVMPKKIGDLYDRLWQRLELSLPACFFLVSVGLWGEKR
jgi:SAM-dependent methyltransferase